MGRRLCMQRDATIYILWYAVCECVRALCTLDQLWRARIDSKSLCWRRTMRARCAVGRFVCRSRSILNYLPLARLPARTQHLSYCVFTPNAACPIYIIWMYGYTHLDLPCMRLLLEQLGPRPKHSNSAAHPLDRRWLTHPNHKSRSELCILYSCHAILINGVSNLFENSFL